MSKKGAQTSEKACKYETFYVSLHVLNETFMAFKLFRSKGPGKPSIRRKTVFSLGTIAVILVLSGVISILEYRRMSEYVSGVVSANIKSITLSRQLSDITEEYNHQMLSVVLDNDLSKMPEFDKEYFMSYSDTLKNSITSETTLPVVERVDTSFVKFIETSQRFDEVFLADTVSTGVWFFETLQPAYNDFCHDMTELNSALHQELQDNSVHFDVSFYRSIIPGVICVCAGLLLVILLMYFTIANYVNPIYKIADGLNLYKSSGKRYGYQMEGDDHLSDINSAVTEIIEENIELKHRIKNLKEDR